MRVSGRVAPFTLGGWCLIALTQALGPHEGPRARPCSSADEASPSGAIISALRAATVAAALVATLRANDASPVISATTPALTSHRAPAAAAIVLLTPTATSTSAAATDKGACATPARHGVLAAPQHKGGPPPPAGGLAFGVATPACGGVGLSPSLSIPGASTAPGALSAAGPAYRPAPTSTIAREAAGSPTTVVCFPSTLGPTAFATLVRLSVASTAPAMSNASERRELGRGGGHRHSSRPRRYRRSRRRPSHRRGTGFSFGAYSAASTISRRCTLSSARLTYLSSPCGCRWHHYGSAHRHSPGYHQGVPYLNALYFLTIRRGRSDRRASRSQWLRRSLRIATTRK